MNDPKDDLAGESSFIELNRIRPLDILLVAGAGKASKAICWGEKVSSGRRARYSHAGIFLSRSLLLEAVEPSIVITELSKGQHSDPLFDSVGDWQSRHPTQLFPRLDNGKLKVFARLPGVTQATVLRHQASEAWGDNLWLLRDDVLQCISCCYLAQYPAVGRLLRTTKFFPPHILDFAEAFAREIQRKVLTGPFCSELVMICLQRIGQFLSPEDGNRKPENFSPSDLEHLRGWEEKLCVVRAPSPEKLPGTGPVDKTFSSDLVSMLSLPTYINQALASKVHLIETLATRILAALEINQHPNAPSTVSIPEAPAIGESHLKVLSDIDHYINEVCDPLWRWIDDANQCLCTCPATRHRLGHKIRLDEPTFSEQWALPSYKVVKRWDGSRCSDIRSCRGVSGAWDQLKRTLESLYREALPSVD